MGASESKNAELESLVRGLSAEDRATLDQATLRMFDAQPSIPLDTFKAHCSVFSVDVAERLFRGLCAREGNAAATGHAHSHAHSHSQAPSRGSSADVLHRDIFSLWIGALIGGAPSNKPALFFALFGADIVDRPSFEACVAEVAARALELDNRVETEALRDAGRGRPEGRSAAAFADAAFYDAQASSPVDRVHSSTIDADRFSRFLSNSPIALALFQATFELGLLGHVTDSARLRLHSYAPARVASSLLDLESAWHVMNQLPADCRSEWRPLYSSKADGKSFNRFTTHAMDKGAVLIIIRDTKGFVFGAFSSQSLSFRPTWTGDASSFVFSLTPRLSVFGATGYNKNFVYLNYGMQTLPNGLGFGGQFDYLLWVDSSFERGHSKGHPLSSTYGNPCLSSEDEFVLQDAEVWGVGPLPAPESGHQDNRSILDKQHQMVAIMELAGKKMHSDGLREPEPPADDDHH
eukprot:Opistho-2@83457